MAPAAICSKACIKVLPSGEWTRVVRPALVLVQRCLPVSCLLVSLFVPDQYIILYSTFGVRNPDLGDWHLATSQTTSSQPLMLHPVVFVYDQPTGVYLAVDSARRPMAVGRSTTSARQSGTRCQMNLEIPTVLITLNGS